MSSLRVGVMIVGMMAVIAGCRPAWKSESATGSPPPAKIITEGDLASIVLTLQAEQRLGIELVAMEKRPMPQRQVVGGELIVPLGRAGNQTNSLPSIYSLMPTMTPTDLVRVAEMQVTANGQIKAAQVELGAARVGLARATSLIENKAGTQRAVDDAQAQVALAEVTLATSQERRALLGAPLFDAWNRDALWVRVPVYAGDLDRINHSAAALVSALGSGTNRASNVARPVRVPFAGGGVSATLDLFYELENAGHGLRAGQKVSVSIPLQGEQESLVAPAAAILYDIYGGTWVYENTAPHTFARRRVSVRAIQDGLAQLARGPRAGTKVVTAGAAELFGTEFGPGK